MSDERSVEELIEDLRDDDWQIRYNAADRLKALGDVRAVEPLIKVLDDDNLTVRFIAAMTLGIVKDPRAVEPLVKVLRQNDDYDVLWAAAWALSEIGALSAEPLIDTLDSRNSLTRDIASDVLGGIGDKRAIEPLGRVFYDYGALDYPETGRFAAADALERLGQASGEMFITALDHEVPEIRARAAEGLGRLRYEPAVPHLIVRLQDEDLPFEHHQNEIRVCDAAAAALEQIGTVEALEALEAWQAEG